MRITETERKNHEQLFPNRTSTLMVTDPELIEVFDNFAFDEVLAYGHLETRTRLLVVLASLSANQALAEYRGMRGGAWNVGGTPGEMKAIVDQAVPYVGMAKGWHVIQATSQVVALRAR